ncbi:MAG: DUF4286 family protein [Saprospiraceae bacterium]
MILYNVTVKVEVSVHDEWLQWMKTVHIPDVLKTGFFVEYKMGRILGQDESDGISYSVQYFCESMALLAQYQKEHAVRLQAAHAEKYKNKYVAFRTLIELI